MQKSLLFLLFFFPVIVHAASPRFPNPKNPDEVWQNDRDLYDRIQTITTSTTLASGSTSYIGNQNTLQSGSTAYPQFLQVGSSATIPTLSNSFFYGSSLTATNISGTTVGASTVTWQNFGILPILQIQKYTTVTSTLTLNTSYVRTTLVGFFTPKLATSKIYVFASATIRQNIGDNGFLTLYRDTTNLSSSASGFFGTTSNNNYDMCIFADDSPSTTSGISYYVMFKTAGGGGSLELAPSIGGTVSEASMLVIEVAQ